MAVSVSINTLTALTQKYFAPGVHDQVFYKKGFLEKMRDREKTLDGGEDIRWKVRHTKNTTSGRWSGGDDTLDTTGQDNFTQAVVDWKYLKSAVVVKKTDILKNMGKARLADLLEEEYENAIESIQDDLEIDLFKDGSVDANGRAGIDGLAAIVNNASGTYGGITRVGASGQKNAPTGNAFWNANKYAANANATFTGYRHAISVDNSTVMTLAKLQDLYSLCDGADLCLTSPALKNKYWSLLTAIQRQMTNDKAGKSGFTSLMFNDAEVHCSENIDNANKWYNLNLRFIELKPHEGMNFLAGEFKKPVNQEVLVQHITWMGNVICRRPNRQGLITGMTAA